MDKLTRHEAIMAILGVPETHLSTVYKAGIIELLYENNVPYTIYANNAKESKGTDNPEMYGRPPNSYISNSSSCG